jgi:hypothetical protein
MRVGFDGGRDHVAQKGFAGVLAGACGALQDDRAVHGIGGLHDGVDLFHVVDVERRKAVAVFRRVIE